MLERPAISEELLLSGLEIEYGLHGIELSFLPLGADEGTVVYRVHAQDGTAYFLKLRKNFDEIIVRIPILLREQGVQAIIVPLVTRSKQAYADFGEYKIILYPFIEGRDGFERELSDPHRQRLGAALKKIHAAQLPPDLRGRIPLETFSSQWRERLKSFQRQVESETFADATAAKLSSFMKLQHADIDQLLERAEQLALELQSKSLDLVLCHSDLHGGNILIGETDQLYIVDWDNPILAPKERDLMFIGGGIDKIWQSEREEAVFYRGYGQTEIDLPALAYYRYERIIEDLAVICEQLLLTEEGGADRERSLGWFTSNFEMGNTLDIARKTDQLSQQRA